MSFLATKMVLIISFTRKNYVIVSPPPKLSRYLKNAGVPDNVSFLVKNEELLKKKKKHGVKFKILWEKSFNDPMFDNNYLKTKLKFHYKKVTITSHSKVYENGSECIELPVFKSSKNCYPQTFLQTF